MCGIAGYTNPLDIDDAVIERMTEVITHRGPDDKGFYIDDGIAMGFRRLSIIDLDGGHQPIVNEDGNLVLTFNGEIYNYRVLKDELVANGHVFTTESDSEVLLHGYEEWGPGLLGRLRGMWGFAIYDKRDRSLFISRDRFGIKPMHYAFVGGSFVYASEIKSILEFPLYERRLDESVLDEYLSFQFVIPPHTFFQGIDCLLPGHFLIYRDGEVTVERYWEATFDPDEDMTYEEAVDAVDKVFTESVEAHRIADVEVGCFLSSGVDSSWVASYFSGQQTFTVGFDVGDVKYDETFYAAPLAERIGTTQHSKTITPAEYFEAFPKAQWHFDQPLADPSAIALYFVSRIASEHVKVVLSGEGADELFGGYRSYHEPLDRARTRQRYPSWLRHLAAMVSSKVPGQQHNRFVRSTKTVQQTYGGDGCGHGGTLFSVAQKRAVLKDPARVRPTEEYAAPFYRSFGDVDDTTAMQLFDINVWMVGDILLKADRMSMANSLELRVPFLDDEVWNVARRIPARLRVNDEGGQEHTKYAMRAAAQRHLPETTAQKPKLGFPTPIRIWLKDERYAALVRETFTSEYAERFFDTGRLTSLLDRHQAGKSDESRRIWTIYSFLVWYQVYFID